jgi:hypothetical protein
MRGSGSRAGALSFERCLLLLNAAAAARALSLNLIAGILHIKISLFLRSSERWREKILQRISFY